MCLLQPNHPPELLQILVSKPTHSLTLISNSNSAYFKTQPLSNSDFHCFKPSSSIFYMFKNSLIPILLKSHLYILTLHLRTTLRTLLLSTALWSTPLTSASNLSSGTPSAFNRACLNSNSDRFTVPIADTA